MIMQSVTRVAALLILTSAPGAACRGAEFWFAGVEPVHPVYPQDYMQLFTRDAPWAQAEARLSVLKVSAETVLHGSDDIIRTIFNAARARRIAMAVEMGAVLQRPADMCGGGEGYMQPAVVHRFGARLHALGLSLDYMAMDGPVWLGHERSWGVTKGRPDCRYSLSEVIQRAAQTVAIMRQYFPVLRVGEIEAVNTRLSPGPVLADYAAFARGMQAATGQGLSFFHCDIAWQFPGWPSVLPLLQAQSHGLGMRFGAIIGGSPQDATDEAWVEDGLQRLQQFAPLLDDVVVQSWQIRPTVMLPETAAGSATHLLREAERLSY